MKEYKKLTLKMCAGSNFYIEGCLHINMLKPLGVQRSTARSSWWLLLMYANVFVFRELEKYLKKIEFNDIKRKQ